MKETVVRLISSLVILGTAIVVLINLHSQKETVDNYLTMKKQSTIAAQEYANNPQQTKYSFEHFPEFAAANRIEYETSLDSFGETYYTVSNMDADSVERYYMNWREKTYPND